MNRVRLTSARGRDIHFFVRGRVDRESAPGDIRSSAKRKFLSLEKRARPEGFEPPAFGLEILDTLSWSGLP
jgi:hypothetical protein